METTKRTKTTKKERENKRSKIEFDKRHKSDGERDIFVFLIKTAKNNFQIKKYLSEYFKYAEFQFSIEKIKKFAYFGRLFNESSFWHSGPVFFEMWINLKFF